MISQEVGDQGCKVDTSYASALARVVSAQHFPYAMCLTVVSYSVPGMHIFKY